MDCLRCGRKLFSQSEREASCVYVARISPGPKTRLPSEPLSEIKEFGSQRDIPYQAMIKLFLSNAIAERMNKEAKGCSPLL
jgi:hypothetical protein